VVDVSLTQLDNGVVESIAVDSYHPARRAVAKMCEWSRK